MSYYSYYPKEWSKDDIDMHIKMINLTNNIYEYQQKQKTEFYKQNEDQKIDIDPPNNSPKLIRESSSVFIEHKKQ